jgi:hypothetical protein
VAAMKIDDKIPGVGTLQSEVDLSPMPHKPITRSQSHQSNDTDLVGTLSDKKKAVLATTLIQKLPTSVLKSSRLQTPELTGALRNLKGCLGIGGSPLESMLSSISPLFTIQTFKNSIVSTRIFKTNNKMGLGSRITDEKLVHYAKSRVPNN